MCLNHEPEMRLLFEQFPLWSSAFVSPVLFAERTTTEASLIDQKRRYLGQE